MGSSDDKSGVRRRRQASTKVQQEREAEIFGYVGDTKFVVPETLDTVQAFHPARLNLGSAMAYLLIFASAALTFTHSYARWVHILVFLFWRCWYDVGLGVILNGQSTTKRFSKWYKRSTADPSTFEAKILQRLAKAGLKDQSLKLSDYPKDFQAWLVYKHIVNLILVNDSCNYILLGYTCFSFPGEVTLLVLAQYAVGVALGAFNYWAKVDAHRCIGEYCWYWGDFFFRKDLNLTFDGIFELFPHPMYTVGYSLYYGYSLICRSYTMLFVSLAAHLMQLGFLLWVEEPHIQRTYGGGEEVVVTMDQARVLYDERSGFFPGKKAPIYYKDWSPFRLADLATVMGMCYCAVVTLLVREPWWMLVHLALWRCLHWLGLGSVLFLQSKRQFWTRHFTQRGRTIYEAFANWKGIYNLSLTMNVAAFVGCALRHFEYSPWELVITTTNMGNAAYLWACITVGVLLVLLSVWASMSTYSAVGEFGWFYGDFFISKDTYDNHLTYTGIYRFLNNPDAVVGYAGLYGAALITQSTTIAAAAAVSQLMNLAFLNLVEAPHMKKLYDEKNMRADAPVIGAIKDVLQGAPAPLREQQVKLEESLRAEARGLRNKALNQTYEVYKKLSASRRNLAAAAKQVGESTKLVVPERVSLGQTLQVSYETVSKHSETDWIGVYSVDVDSAPGVSNGCWVYVPPEAKGTVKFPPSLLPRNEGVYEVRYHLRNRYIVVDTVPLIIEGIGSASDVDEE